MMICPECEQPIKTGERVRGSFICEFREEVTGVTHSVKVLSEEWLEHKDCNG